MARFIKDIKISEDWDTTTYPRFKVKKLVVISDDNEVLEIPLHPNLGRFAWKLNDNFRFTDMDLFDYFWLTETQIVEFLQLQLSVDITIDDILDDGFIFSQSRLAVASGNSSLNNLWGRFPSFYCYDQKDCPDGEINVGDEYAKYSPTHDKPIVTLESGMTSWVTNKDFLTNLVSIDTTYYTSHISKISLEKTRDQFISENSLSVPPSNLVASLGLYSSSTSIYNFATRSIDATAIGYIGPDEDLSSVSTPDTQFTMSGGCYTANNDTATTTYNYTYPTTPHCRAYSTLGQSLDLTSLIIPSQTFAITSSSGLPFLNHVVRSDHDDGCEDYDIENARDISTGISVQYYTPNNDVVSSIFEVIPIETLNPSPVSSLVGEVIYGNYYGTNTPDGVAFDDIPIFAYYEDFTEAKAIAFGSNSILNSSCGLSVSWHIVVDTSNILVAYYDYSGIGPIGWEFPTIRKWFRGYKDKFDGSIFTEYDLFDFCFLYDYYFPFIVNYTGIIGNYCMNYDTGTYRVEISSDVSFIYEIINIEELFTDDYFEIPYKSMTINGRDVIDL